MTFVSSLYGGPISDKEMTCVSGIIPLLDEHDSVMADKGFEIVNLLTPKKCTLNIPPILQNGEQFSAEEAEETQSIAQVRINM